MKKTYRCMCAPLLTGLALLLAPAVAHAFNTAPHYWATAAGLDAQGFSEAAIRRVFIANFQVDYIIGKRDTVDDMRKGANLTISALAGLVCSDESCRQVANRAAYFHFDSIPSGDLVAENFARLEAAAKVVVTKASADADKGGNESAAAERILDALGITLHAVQDFYAHSTYAEVGWTPLVGAHVPALDEVPLPLWATQVHTGKAGASLYTYGTLPLPSPWVRHGSSMTTGCAPGGTDACGQNHDSVLRRGHFRAALGAAYSSRLWAMRFERWVAKPSLWKKIAHFDPGTGWVDECVRRARLESSYADRWSYAHRGSTSKFPMIIQQITDDCSDDWQDKRWSSTLAQLYTAAAPAELTKPKSYTDVATASALAGSYAIVVGSRAGTLTLTSAGGGAMKGSLELEAGPDGSKAMKLSGGAQEGRVVLHLAGPSDGQSLRFTQVADKTIAGTAIFHPAAAGFYGKRK